MTKTKCLLLTLITLTSLVSCSSSFNQGRSPNSDQYSRGEAAEIPKEGYLSENLMDYGQFLKFRENVKSINIKLSKQIRYACDKKTGAITNAQFLRQNRSLLDHYRRWKIKPERLNLKKKAELQITLKNGDLKKFNIQGLLLPPTYDSQNVRESYRKGYYLAGADTCVILNLETSLSGKVIFGHDAEKADKVAAYYKKQDNLSIFNDKAGFHIPMNSALAVYMGCHQDIIPECDKQYNPNTDW